MNDKKKPSLPLKSILKTVGACYDSQDWIGNKRDALSAWLTCTHADWLTWIAITFLKFHGKPSAKKKLEFDTKLANAIRVMVLSAIEQFNTKNTGYAPTGYDSFSKADLYWLGRLLPALHTMASGHIMGRGAVFGHAHPQLGSTDNIFLSGFYEAMNWMATVHGDPAKCEPSNYDNIAKAMVKMYRGLHPDATHESAHVGVCNAIRQVIACPTIPGSVITKTQKQMAKNKRR